MGNVKIKIEYFKEANYSLIHNRIPLCKSLELENVGSTTLEHLQVCCSGQFLKDTCTEVGNLRPGEKLRTTQLEILPDVDLLLNMTERVTTGFTLKIKSGEECVQEESFELALMAYDQWLGISVLPQMLVSFITPNHPAISSLLVDAAQLLKPLTGSTSFVEYQTGNSNDVRMQVAAIYGAIHNLGIVYRSLPASFEEKGQRVTMPDQLIASKLGNCLELTLLFASALEAVGINCGVVVANGHAYLGVWLVDDSCAYSICDDVSFLEKKCSKGINELLMLECTFTAESGKSFEDAVRAGDKHLSDNNFLLFLDVRRCRLEKFLPLPGRIQTDGKWKLVNEGIDHGKCITEVKLHDRYDLTNLRESKRELTKLDIWERKLLDLSLRNSLLNLSLRRKAVQFISFELDKIEDHLSDGEEYCIMGKPDVDFKQNPEEKLVKSKSMEVLRDLVVSDIDHHRLHTYHTENETKSILKNIYRGARNAIEETGANSLFLTIGTLRWYETPRSESPRYAPLILVPVEIVYKRGGYYIRTRDEETTLNITLLEFLRQNFDMTINGLDPLPKDGHGVDVSLVFALMRDALKEQKRWDIEEECILGTFSFSKFLMWNDVHNHRKELLENPVVSSLVKNGLTWTPDAVCADLRETDSQVSPCDIALPVSVDSSQMSAVLEGGKGHSFILYGPPGTGKSQTITNLIANALFQGKRVLFVAEKMAALSVVQTRLAKIGLEPFCLEMHSNKVTKKHILEQLSKALGVSHIQSPAAYANRAEQLFAHRKQLIDYLKALHDRNAEDGLSLYDCIVRYESIEKEPLNEFELNHCLDDVLKKSGFQPIEDLLGSKLETILKLVGQPSESALIGLKVGDDFQTNDLVSKLQEALQLVTDAQQRTAELRELKDLRELLQRDNKESFLQQDGKRWYDEWRSIKAKWFLPRFFAKRSYLERLRQYNSYIVENDVDALLERLMKYNKLHAEMERLHMVFATYRHLQLPEDEMPSAQLLTETAQLLDKWIAHQDQMRDWLHWCNYSHDLQQIGLGSVVKALENRTFSAKQLHDSFFKALFKSKADQRISHSTMLSTFEGMLFDEKVKTYRRINEEFQLLTQKELYARLAAGIPRVGDNIDSSSEIGLLNRNISNGGRGTSLRELFDQIPTLMPRLCPCMLMSPMSVAQYLDLSQDKFDLVIFDEASQMPTSEAVGAIARGKALIVVGDPKQMPPTSFFSSTNVDEEEASIDDMESILEDCRTLGIPSLQLNWHYRSRHESLIAFSNQEYYDGKLITFPSVDDQETKVNYVPVEGYYDKGGKRSNRSEADAIVNEIVRRLKDKELCKKSIGVIAFSVVQQALIEDILQEKLDADSSLREAATQLYEPIFVKNLENVQGDERDVILFSIGYGPTKDGTVSMNFGPLNNSGGERRLNVAVSRARHEMLVFSTLKASQIDLRRSQAKGVEGLKHFLEYAETQTLARLNSELDQPEGTIVAQQIAHELESKGYVAKVNVGRSMFKVDVAISQPQHPETYLMGILMDGQGYRDTQTTRDREIVQPSVLSGLNWKVMRVWSVDWYTNKERVLSRILEQLEQGEDKKVEKEKPLKFDISAEKEVVLETLAREYITYVPDIRKLPKMTDEQLIKQIVKAEQPISLMLLCRRLCELKKTARVTPTLQREVQEVVKSAFYVEDDRKGEVVWTDQETSLTYKWYRTDNERDILDIPMVEIRNAVLEAIREQFSIAMENVTLIGAKKLGFTRRGSNVELAFKLALQQLLEAGIIEEKEGRLTLH